MVIQAFLARVAPLPVIDLCERILLSNYRLTLAMLTSVDPCSLEIISRRRAERVFHYARKNVPAYQNFIRRCISFDQAPPTTKANYIRRYSHEKRCVGGHLPLHGNIDESAGSSGKPTQWIRSFEEEHLLRKLIHFEYEYLFRAGMARKKFIVLSAWSAGPWATGVKFCELMQHHSIVKETSTSIKNIIETMQTFTNKYAYLIAGYPPFLRLLFEKQFDWKDYDIHLVTGGESISLGLERYLASRLRKGALIISSYGCSDIDIGIAVETPLCKFIRQMAHSHKKLCKELFGTNEAPMLFQYNPLSHYIENIVYDGKPEFLATLLDIHAASPKVRYAIHDSGGTLPFRSVMAIIQNHLGKNTSRAEFCDALHLPFLWIAGRSDETLSLDGAKVSPKLIEHIIFTTPYLSRRVHRFLMSKTEKVHIEFHIHLELKKGVSPSSSLKKEAHDLIVAHLIRENADFAESIQHNPTLDPIITLFGLNKGPFADLDKKLKLRYIT